MQGASVSLNPNDHDLPGYGSFNQDPVREDQQVMGAQSTATAAQGSSLAPEAMDSQQPGFLDMDGETVVGRLGEGTDQDEGAAGMAALRNPEALLNGSRPAVPKAETRTSRVGTILSEVSAAMQGVVKASSGVRVQVQRGNRGASSVGTEGTAGTGGSGYATAVSEAEGNDLPPGAEASGRDSREPLFSAEQAERLETMTKAAPLLYPEANSTPELPHSVSSGSGEAIQTEVRRQLQQFMNVQVELERRLVLLQRENEALRRGEVGPGMDQGVRGWLGGLGRGLMGFVQQGAAKAGHPPVLTSSTVATMSQVSSVPLPPPEYAIGMQANLGTPAYATGTGQVSGALPCAAGQALGSAQQGTGQVSGVLPCAAGQALGSVHQGTGQVTGALPYATGQVTGAVQQGTGQVTGASPYVTGQVQGAVQQGTGQVTGASPYVTGQVQGALQPGTGQVQGALQPGTGQVQGALQPGTGKVQGALQQGTGQVQGASQQGTGQVSGAIPQGAGQVQGAPYHDAAQGSGILRQEGLNPAAPYDAMMSGIVQLQGIMAQLASKSVGSGSTGSNMAPEVVRPGVTEVAKLPNATPEAALQFSDWLHAVRPSMSDLSDSSAQCWESVLGEAQRWYNSSFVPATPVQRLRLKLPNSVLDSETKWARVKHRMEHLVLQACPEGVREELSSARISGLLHVLCRLHVIYKPGGLPERTEALRQVQSPKAADSAVDAVLKLRTWRRWLTRLGDLGGSRPDPAMQIQALETITAGVLKSMSTINFRVNLVRASLQLDTQPTNDRVEEFFEHVLAELESVSRATEATKEGKDRGGQVRQVEAKATPGSQADGAGPPKSSARPTAPSAGSGGEVGKKLCRWYHDGKGCRKGGECTFQHDWNSIPKPERADRCMRCGGSGHKKDTCTAPAGTPKARSEGSPSKASAKEGAPRPKADPGLKKVLSEAAGVLREALRSTATEGETPVEQGSPMSKTGSAGPSTESPSAAARAAADPPVMATAAKIEAQLQNLEARVMEGNARVRAVSTREAQGLSEPTALLDSGATHTVLDPTAISATDDLSPCMVSLAGDQKQLWKQTPGGSLVAPRRDGGGETQTILPLGSLIEQLGCSVKWTRKAGLQLVHPRLGKLDTSMRSGCPQISKHQALQLVA